MRSHLNALPDQLLDEATKDNGKDIKTIEELLLGYQGKKIHEDIQLLLSNLKVQLLLSNLKDSYARIPMINPTKEKFKFTTLNYTYYELLRMFSNEMERENSVLFVMGFSFADEHLREIVLRAINSNPTLIVYIFPYDAKAKEQIKGYLKFQDCLPKNNNLKFVVHEDETIKNDLANINMNYFEKLADSLIRPEQSKSTPTDLDGEKNE